MKKLVKATQDTDIYDESIEQNLNAVRECKTREEMVALLKTTNKLMLVFMADLPDNGISRLTKQDLIDEVIVRECTINCVKGKRDRRQNYGTNSGTGTQEN